MTRLHIATLTACVALLSPGCSKDTAPANELASAPNTPPGPALLASLHFQGTDTLKPIQGASKLREVLARPASRSLIDHTLNRLAESLQPALLAQAAGAAPNAAKPLRPLLDDLVRFESYLRIGRSAQGDTHCVLAVKLPHERAAAWQTGLTNAPPSLNLSLLQSSGWFVAGFGTGQAEHLTAITNRIATRGSPVESATTNWLDLDVDLPKLTKWFPAFQNLDLPRITLAANGRGEQLRLTGSALFSHPILPSLPKWRFPTNSIRMPLVGFTAARALDRWQAYVRPFEKLGFPKPPGQIFCWAQQSSPFQSFAAMIVDNSQTTIAALAAKLPQVLEEAFPGKAHGKIQHDEGGKALLWSGVPFLAPFIHTSPDTDPQLVVAGAFLLDSPNEPLPEAMLKQFIDSPDILHYGWEITLARLSHWRALVRFPSMIAGNPVPPTTPAQNWIEDMLGPYLKSQLGQTPVHWPNTITEARMRSPSHIDFVRNAPLGLTAIEVVKLLDWIDSKDFPAPGLRAPQKPPATTRTN